MQRQKLLGDVFRLDEPTLAIAMTGDAPEVGPIIDVQRGLCAVLPGKSQCFHHGWAG